MICDYPQHSEFIMGNVNAQTCAEIFANETFKQFRMRHISNINTPPCNTCADCPDINVSFNAPLMPHMGRPRDRNNISCLRFELLYTFEKDNSGYSETQVLYSDCLLINGEFEIVFDLNKIKDINAVKGLRLDPGDNPITLDVNKAVVVCNASNEEQVLKIIHTNANVIKDSSLIFHSYDPQIYFACNDIKLIETSSLFVSGNCLFQ